MEAFNCIRTSKPVRRVSYNTRFHLDDWYFTNLSTMKSACCFANKKARPHSMLVAFRRDLFVVPLLIRWLKITSLKSNVLIIIFSLFDKRNSIVILVLMWVKEKTGVWISLPAQKVNELNDWICVTIPSLL